MTYDEMADVREVLISQGVDVPDLRDDYYNMDDKFDTFSCATGDYRNAPDDDDDDIAVKVESDTDTYSTTDSDTFLSETETECSDTRQYSGASTVYTTSQINSNSNVPVVAKAVGVNDEHEGMNYDLLLDDADESEEYTFNEHIVQTGKLVFNKAFYNLTIFYNIFSTWMAFGNLSPSWITRRPRE